MVLYSRLTAVNLFIIIYIIAIIVKLISDPKGNENDDHREQQ